MRSTWVVPDAGWRSHPMTISSVLPAGRPRCGRRNRSMSGLPRTTKRFSVCLTHRWTMPV